MSAPTPADQLAKLHGEVGRVCDELLQLCADADDLRYGTLATHVVRGYVTQLAGAVADTGDRAGD